MRRSPERQQARVLDGVLEVEEHARARARSRARPPGPCRACSRSRWRSRVRSSVGIEQRMAGADEGRERLALRRDQLLLEGDALVARQHRLADADLAVAVADRRRDVGDLVAARLALAGRVPPRRWNASRKNDSM